MQGRLVDSEKKNEIQFFPKKKLEKKELKYFKKNKIKFIEWVASHENLVANPIYQKKVFVIKKECKKNRVKVRSIDAQFFVKKPIYKGNIIDRKSHYKKLKKFLLILNFLTSNIL